jgi:hypothetical protein
VAREQPEDGLAAFWDGGKDLILAQARRLSAERRTKPIRRSSPRRGMPEFSAEGFLLDDGWKLVEVEPEVVEVHATNGTNGNCHHDEAAEPQQTLFYRPLWTHRAPSHISKTVLSTVHLGPPNWTRSRTFTLRFTLAL